MQNSVFENVEKEELDTVNGGIAVGTACLIIAGGVVDVSGVMNVFSDYQHAKHENEK